MKDTRSNEELNRIIAEWMGWVYTSHGCGYETRYRGTPSETTVLVPIPNYCTDLNAIHEACQKLFTLKSKRWYRLEFCTLADDYDVEIQMMSKSSGQGLRWNHNARQRAEALVKVIEAKGEK